ncbi:hypothetical protein [Alsobacter sp. SYSU BS001988]|jgi:hypothetical protein
MKILQPSDLFAASLAFCHEQTRIAELSSGHETTPCQQPCESCLAAMRAALQVIADKAEFKLETEYHSSKH